MSIGLKPWNPPPIPAFQTVDFEASQRTSSGAPVQAVLPPSAQCLKTARITSLGKFTARSFDLEIPAASGECQVPAGMLLKSQDGLQDMLVLATEQVSFSGGPAKVTIYANCVDADKKGPKVGSTYLIAGMVDPSSDLGKIVRHLPTLPPDQVTVVGLQAAVWVVTNDIDRGHLGRIFPVTEADLVSTRAILEGAGIDPAVKTLFR